MAHNFTSLRLQIGVTKGSGRGEPMAYYRLYFMHGATERVESFDEFEASDDFYISIVRNEKPTIVLPLYGLRH